jgi:hypothetical protein
MARAGRDLERLAAILEELLRPSGLLFRSPDHLRDTVTGRLREVDVAIRASEEGAVIAICECRDRAGVEDVTWIEQVVTKARDLEGCPPAVLVSSAGFSEAAREKANAYGHDVRLVTEVTLEEFRTWFAVEHVVLLVTERGLRGCDIELAGEPAEAFSPAVTGALAKEGLGACIFERQRLWPVSAMHIFEEWWKQTHEQVERDVPSDGRPFRRPVPIRSKNPRSASRSRPIPALVLSRRCACTSRSRGRNAWCQPLASRAIRRMEMGSPRASSSTSTRTWERSRSTR